jgi:voltage-gated potassium channel Kch
LCHNSRQSASFFQNAFIPSLPSKTSIKEIAASAEFLLAQTIQSFVFRDSLHPAMSHHSPTAPSPKRRLKIILTGGVLFIGLLGLGYYGWLETLREATGKVLYYDALSNTVDLVAGEKAVVVGDLHKAHWTLIVAALGIKALLAVAIFQSAAYFSQQRLRRWRFRRVSGHDAFLGLASFNAELARRSIEEGLRVAVVDPDENHAARASLEAQGVLFLSGSSLDSELLRSAGVHRARRIVIDTGKDEQNVAAAEMSAALIKAGSGPSVESWFRWHALPRVTCCGSDGT